MDQKPVQSNAYRPGYRNGLSGLLVDLYVSNSNGKFSSRDWQTYMYCCDFDFMTPMTARTVYEQMIFQQTKFE